MHHGCRIACVALDSDDPPGRMEQVLRQARRRLDPVLVARIDRLRQPADRLRSMLGHLLLRHMLHAAGVAGAPQIELGPYGKPRLRMASPLEFNVSHAGQWVVCALAPTAVGIDIERVREIDLRIAERFFQPAEYAALMAHAPGQRAACFFRLWTAKEAYVKALGLGLRRDFASFGVAPLDDPSMPVQHLALTYPAFVEHYQLALCTAAAPPPQPTTVTIDRLLAPGWPG